MRSARVSTTFTLLAYRLSARWLAFSERPKNVCRRTRSGLIRTVVSRLGDGLRCGQHSSTWSRLRTRSAPRRNRRLRAEVQAVTRDNREPGTTPAPSCPLYVANVRQLIILPDGEKSGEPALS